MKNSIYILLFSILTMMSCSMKEDFQPEHGQNCSVEFIVRPTSFNVCNVASPQTKSSYIAPAYSGDQLTALEKKIVNAYFLIFRPDGQLYQPAENLAITNNVITEAKIKADATESNITACFIANVPESYINDIKDIDDLATKPLPLEYVSYESAGYIGIPSLNGTPCFPMFGMYVGPVSTDKTQIQISLKRLFAKVQVNLSMDMTPGISLGDSGSELGLSHSADANFTLFDYTVSNLPKQIMLTSKTSEGTLTDVITESPWGDNPAGYDFMDDLNVNFGTLTPQIYDKDNVDNNHIELYSFSCYVPEYSLLPNGNEEDYSILTSNRERFKPLLYDNGQKPICLTLNGRLAQQDGTFTNVKYDVYLGENNFDSFSMFRNNLYRNNLTIGGADHLTSGDSNIDHRVEILPLNLVEVYGQAANCYIISLPGTYEIDTYKGVVKNLSSASKLQGKSAGVVWNTNANNSISVTLAENKTKVIVTVGGNSSGAVEPGNALVALYGEDDSISWSWHLWLCADDNRADKPAFLDKYVDDSGSYNGYQVMDRALGATDMGGWTLGDYKLSMWNDGLYYQWGRKDPIRLNADETAVFDDADDDYDGTFGGASYGNSIKNPKVFYSDWAGTYTSEDTDASGWAADKSLNDPCPPGYKVPANTIWRSKNPDATQKLPLINTKLTNDERYTYNTSQLSLTGSTSTFIFFPYGGNLDASGNRVATAKSVVRDTTDADYPPIEYGIIEPRESPIPHLVTPKQFRNVIFEFGHNVNHGMYWANNALSLLYGYSTVDSSSGGLLSSILGGYNVISCEYQTGTMNYRTEQRQTGTIPIINRPIYTTYYIYDGTVTWNNNWRTVYEEEYDGINFLDERRDVNDGLEDYLNDKGVQTESYEYSREKQMDKHNGLQIRCVKE